MLLDYRVFLHSYEGMSSTSILFYGEKDAVLIDASQLLSDAHRLAAELILMGKNITHIYVSHFHPDHHFGLGVLCYAFPQARVVARPSVVKDIVFTTNDKIFMWGGYYGADQPDRGVIPMPLAEPRLEVEGHALELSDGWAGDCPNNTVVWAPDLGVLCASDVVELDCHLWTVESDAERRMKWRESIRKLRDFGARVVVPGHISPQALLRLEDTSAIDFSLRYLDVYEAVLAQARSGEQLVAGMERHYPGMKTEDFGLQWQARLLFPKSCPEWFAKLPGEPGEIFLSPEGVYLGEPARE